MLRNQDYNAVISTGREIISHSTIGTADTKRISIPSFHDEISLTIAHTHTHTNIPIDTVRTVTGTIDQTTTSKTLAFVCVHLNKYTLLAK